MDSAGLPPIGGLGLGPSEQGSRGGWFSRVAEAGRGAARGVNFPLLITVLLSVVLFSLSVFVVYRFLVTSLKVTTLVPDPVDMNTAAPTAVEASTLPGLNGREFSVSLWVYCGTHTQTATQRPFVTFENAAAKPVVRVVQDKNISRLYFVLMTDAMKTQPADGDTVESILRTFKGAAAGAPIAANNYVVVPVDYVPLQRWLNLVLVVDQDVATVYMDGDIYNVHTTTSQVTEDVTATKRTYFADPTGGRVSFDSALNGHMSRLQFFNYAVSVYHARSLYAAGPTDQGFLSWLGVSNYKLQWPIAEATA